MYRNTSKATVPVEHVLALPDYLRPNLALVFVGLNPGLYSAQVGKYFARKTNRFWPALSASGLVGRDANAGDEAILLERGIGFTDVVERATSQIDELSEEEIAAGARRLRRKIKKHSPQVACFIGLTGFRWVFEVPNKIRVKPGPREERIGSTRVYILPSTSPANAHYLLDSMVAEFSRLESWLASINITF